MPSIAAVALMTHRLTASLARHRRPPTVTAVTASTAGLRVSTRHRNQPSDDSSDFAGTIRPSRVRAAADVTEADLR